MVGPNQRGGSGAGADEGEAEQRRGREVEPDPAVLRQKTLEERLLVFSRVATPV